MHPNAEVAIIGAGASGLVLAILIANRVSVAILDANNSLAPKLKINERIIIIEDNDETLKAYNKNGGAVFLKFISKQLVERFLVVLLFVVEIF